VTDGIFGPAADEAGCDAPPTFLMARVGEEFPLECPACGGDIRLIAFITDPRPIRKILTHLGEPLEPPPVSPARGPPTDWGELAQVHDDRENPMRLMPLTIVWSWPWLGCTRSRSGCSRRSGRR